MAASAKTVDMTNVKERGNFNPRHVPEGDYRAKIVKVEDHMSKQNNFQWLYTLQGVDGKVKGATYPLYCGIGPDELWKVRNLFVAAGVPVPKKRQKLDPNKVLNKVVGISLEDDEYNGKTKSKIQATIPASEVGDAPAGDADDDDVEEEPAAEETTAKSNGKKKDKKGKHGKKGKEVKDSELQELDVDEI